MYEEYIWIQFTFLLTFRFLFVLVPVVFLLFVLVFLFRLTLVTLLFLVTFLTVRLTGLATGGALLVEGPGIAKSISSSTSSFSGSEAESDSVSPSSKDCKLTEWSLSSSDPSSMKSSMARLLLLFELAPALKLVSNWTVLLELLLLTWGSRRLDYYMLIVIASLQINVLLNFCLLWFIEQTNQSSASPTANSEILQGPLRSPFCVRVSSIIFSALGAVFDRERTVHVIHTVQANTNRCSHSHPATVLNKINELVYKTLVFSSS